MSAPPPYGFGVTQTKDTRMGSLQKPLQSNQQRIGQFGDLSQYVIPPDFSVWNDPIQEYIPEQHVQINTSVLQNKNQATPSIGTEAIAIQRQHTQQNEPPHPTNEYQVTRVNNTKKPKLQLGKIQPGDKKPEISTKASSVPMAEGAQKNTPILSTSSVQSISYQKTKDLQPEVHQHVVSPDTIQKRANYTKPENISINQPQIQAQKIEQDTHHAGNSGMPYQVERVHTTQKLVTQKIVVDTPKDNTDNTATHTNGKIGHTQPKPSQQVIETDHPAHLNTTLIVKKIKPILDETGEEKLIKKQELSNQIPQSNTPKEIQQPKEAPQPQTRPSSLEFVPPNQSAQEAPPRPQTTPALENKKKHKKKAEKKGIALLNELQSRTSQQPKPKTQAQPQQQMKSTQRIPRGSQKHSLSGLPPGVVSNIGMEDQFIPQTSSSIEDEPHHNYPPRIFSNVGMEEGINQNPIGTKACDIPTGSPVARRVLSDPPKAAQKMASKPEPSAPPLPPNLVSPPLSRRPITPIVKDESNTPKDPFAQPTKIVMPPTIEPQPSPPSSPPQEAAKDPIKEKEIRKPASHPRSFITAPSNTVIANHNQDSPKPQENTKELKAVEVPKTKKPKVFNLPTAADAMRQKQSPLPKAPQLTPKEPEKKYEEPLGISDLDANSGLDLLAAASMNLSAEQLVPQKVNPIVTSEPKVDVVKPKKHGGIEMIIPRSSSVGDVSSLDTKGKKEMDEKEMRKATMEAESGLKVQLNPNPPPIKEPPAPIEIKVEKIQNANLRYLTKPKPKPKPKPMKTITLGSNGIKVEEIPVAEESEPPPPPPKPTNQIQQNKKDPVNTNMDQQSNNNHIAPSQNNDQQAATVPIEEIVPIVTKNYEDSLDDIPIIQEEKDEHKEPIVYPTLEMPKVDMEIFFNSPYIDNKLNKKKQKIFEKCLSSDALDSLLKDDNNNKEEEKDYDSEDALDAYLEHRYAIEPQSIPEVTIRTTSFTEYYRYGSEKAPEVEPEITNFHHIYTIDPHMPIARQPAPIFFDLPPLIVDERDKSETEVKVNEEEPVWHTIAHEWTKMKPNLPGFIASYPLALCELEDEEVEQREEITIASARKPAPAPSLTAAPIPTEHSKEEDEEEDYAEAPKRFCDNYMIASIAICFILGATSLVLHLFYKY